MSLSYFARGGSRTTVPPSASSLEGAQICAVEEAQGISARSWEILIPTIRAPGSEFYIAFNPDLETDPTYQKFVVSPPDNCITVKTTWRDNAYFPAPLRGEMEYLQRVDEDAFQHVWEGKVRTHSDAQVFRGKFTATEHFTPQEGWSYFYGADWGFAKDPTVLVKCWVYERTLYVEHEAYGVGVDIDRTPELFDSVPGARNATIRADSSRPETLSHLKRHGYPGTTPAAKWPNCAMDGVAFMRQFENIVIHPRCKRTAEEFRLLAFKVNKLTGEIIPELASGHDHCVDAIRYALEMLIRPSGQGIFDYYAKRTTAPKPDANGNTPSPAADRTGSPSLLPGANPAPISPHRFVSDRPEADLTGLAPTPAQIAIYFSRGRK
ncbi:MAG TPA: terminase large subunit [Steroidobacteraceae bacterium]|nr:terminase large subunit [Steroidobacteraceae bacterium]